MTITYRSSVQSKNGAILYKVSDFEQLRKQAEGKDKEHQPINYVYEGKKGIYIPSNVFFIDIDSTEKVDEILSDTDKLFSVIPCIYLAQKSYSGKLHLICLHKIQYTTEEDWTYATAVMSGVVNEIVKRTYNIDYYAIKGLDNHNCKYTQGLYFSANPFYINQYATPLSISSRDEKHIVELYPLLFNTHKRQVETKTTSSFVEGENKEKVIVDANFFVGKYSGNDLRWRISVVAKNIFGEGAKDFCDQYFIDKFGKSIFTLPARDIPSNTIVRNWLVEEGYIKLKKQEEALYVIKKGHYITDFRELITNEIRNNQRLLIEAPTGTGKTSLINGCINKSIDNNSFEEIKEIEGLSKEFNAVVIVPYNATNNLYNNLIEVSSSKSNTIQEDKPCVMVWDQAVKYWELIKNRTLFIDESHTLYLDRSYRDSAVRLISLIKRDNSKVVLFTATPNDEAQELNAKVLKISNERDIINLNFINTNNSSVAEYTYIKKTLENQKYDKIVLFDDRNAKKIYEKLLLDGRFNDDIAYIRASTKESLDFLTLKDKEMLIKPLTICTCIAFQGLNFVNENEKILVVCGAKEGSTLASELIQEVGRIRKSKVDARVYWEECDKEENTSIRVQRANRLDTFASTNNINTLLLPIETRLTDAEVADALIRIEHYLSDNSHKEVILKKLNEVGYFNVTETTYELKDKDGKPISRLQLALKKKCSDEFRDDLKDGSWEDKDYQEDYKADWKHRIKRLIRDYDGVNIDLFLKLLDHSQKKVLVETVIADVERIVKICTVSDSDWQHYIDQLDAIRANYDKEDKIGRKEFERSYKHNLDIRTKYANIRNRNTVEIPDDLFTALIDEYESKMNDFRAQASLQGKKGQAYKDNKTGQIFDRRKAIGDFYGKSSKWVLIHIENGDFSKI